MTTDNQLASLGSNIWTATREFKLLKINFGNRMTIIRTGGSNITLHTPVRFSANLKAQIDELGDVKFLIAPNLMHNLFLDEWKKAYPSAEIIAPTGIKKVNPDRPMKDISSNLWNNELIKIQTNGMPALKESIFLHPESKTLILTDLAFNFHKTGGWWTRTVLTLYGSYNKFGPTRLIRSLVKDLNAFKESMNEVVSSEFDKIIVSHGDIVLENAKATFTDAFSDYIDDPQGISESKA